jgi:hypothetical protein
MVGEAFARPMLREMEDGDYDASSLSIIMSGGAPTTQQSKDGVARLLPHVSSTSCWERPRPAARSSAPTSPRTAWTRASSRGTPAPTSRSGYHGVSIQQIGKAAGTSGARVYATLREQAGHPHDAANYAIAKLAVAIDASLATARAADQALGLIEQTFAETVFSNSDIIVITAREAEALPEQQRDQVARRRAEFRDLCGDVLSQVRTDTDPRAPARSQRAPTRPSRRSP